MATATEIQVAEALWMAISALEGEAEVLRVVAGGKHIHLADVAETQARQLREFAQGHARRVRDAVAGEGGPDGLDGLEGLGRSEDY